MHEVNSAFARLSDWVEGFEKKDERNDTIHINTVPANQEQFRGTHPLVGESVKKFREELRKLS